MIKSNYIVHDCETGGLDENKNPITQYAAVVLDYKTLKEVDRWETFVQPYEDLKIEQGALNATMVTMSDVNSGITVQEFIKTATTFWEGHRARTRTRDMGRLVSVGHNVTFDHRFLEYAVNIQNKTIWEYFQNNFVDTFVLAKMTFGLKGDEKLNLGATCGYTGIDLTDAHGAMNDVEATADLFRYFVKNLRKTKGVKAEATTDERAKGSEFFEFKCGVR